MTVPESRFFLKSEWGPISDRWPALSFSKRSVADFLNAEYNPTRDFIVYAGTGNPERTKEAQYRKRLLSVLITEPGKTIPTEDLVPWDSWQDALKEHDKIWPHSFGVRAAWGINRLPSANELTPQAYRSLGVRRNWGGVIEILGSEREALFPLAVEWVELPNRSVVQAASSDRDQLSYVRDDDGSHHWSSPSEPFHFSFHGHSNIIRLLDAFQRASLFERKALRAFREYWQAFAFVDIGNDPMSDALPSSIRWPQLTKLNYGMLQMLDLGPACAQEDQQTIYHYLLFPLYAFDLTESKNFRDLPPPDSPYDEYY